MAIFSRMRMFSTSNSPDPPSSHSMSVPSFTEGDAYDHSGLTTTRAVAGVATTSAVSTAPELDGAPAADLGVASWGAAAEEAVHAATGLPWWASLPLTTLGLKVALLPVSLRQAKLVRTSLGLWSQSYVLAKQQAAKKRQGAAAAGDVQQAAAGRHQQERQDAIAPPSTSHARPPLGTPGTTLGPDLDQRLAVQLEALAFYQRRLTLYHELRTQCSVPHPSWILVNQLLQAAVFVYASVTIRRMAAVQWPGFSSEGALWFPDLTQPAMVAALSAGAAGVGSDALGLGLGLGPMGAAGVALPLGVTGLTLLAIRNGFRASGTASRLPGVADTQLARFLQVLPPLLYTVTLAALYIKVQVPQAALLHWGASISFTLGLQRALRLPTVRRHLGLPAQPGAPVTGVAQEGSVSSLVQTRADAADDASLLVVMGAQQSARQRYADALYCLERAVRLDPANARAHYALGQVCSLTQQWDLAEAAFLRCAQASAAAGDVAAQGQALYCAGSAQASQARHREALGSYAAAAALWPGQGAVLGLAAARVHLQLGELAEAEAATNMALRDEGSAAAAVRPALLQLRRKVADRSKASG